MVSIGRKKRNKILKIIFITTISFLVYKISFAFYNYITFDTKKNSLLSQIALEQQKNETLVYEYKTLQEEINLIKKSYISKEDLQIKLKEIFKRFSISSYKVVYLGLNQRCIDKFVIALRVEALNEKNKELALSLLKNFGEIKKADDSSSLYFITYISRVKK